MTATTPGAQVRACRRFNVGPVAIGGDAPLAVIAGPCVIESREHALRMADALAEVAARLSLPLVFKASYDKANRSSIDSYRGPGIEEGLEVLGEARRRTGLPILTDVHTEEQAAIAGKVCDMIQVPAFLSRQTDLLLAAARAGAAVNLKKAQFMAPEDVVNPVAKLRAGGCENVLLTERGSSFGYRTLVSDFRSLPAMRELTGQPVCFDATHSVQQPGGLGHATGGKREFVPVLARAACAVGINALFLEVHDDPDDALSDGPNMVPLAEFEALMRQCLALDAVVRGA